MLRVVHTGILFDLECVKTHNINYHNIKYHNIKYHNIKYHNIKYATDNFE